MNILMLLTKPYLQDGRVIKEATTLTEAGHDVTVLQWARHEPDAPRSQEHEGVRIERVLDPLPRLPGPVVRNPLWWAAGRRKATRLHEIRRFDVVHAHDLDTLPIAVALKRRHGSRIVYDAHEVFSYMVEVQHPLAARVAHRLERRLLPRVDQVITVNDAMAAMYPPGTRVVANCPRLPPEPEVPKPPFSVTYIGVLSRDRFFPDAVHALGEAGIPLTIAGKKEGCYDEVQAVSKRHESVRFLGTVPAADVPRRTAAGHVVLCMFDPRHRINRIGSPNKLYEAMAAGRPIITTKGTYSGDFTQRHGIGIAIDYDAGALVEAVRRLQDDPELCRAMGRHGRRLATETFHWDAQAATLLDVYAKLAELGEAR